MPATTRSAIRPDVLRAVTCFDPRATLAAGQITLGDGTVLPNETRALQWVVATYRRQQRAMRRRPGAVSPLAPRGRAHAHPDLAAALAVVEAALGPVEVVALRPNPPNQPGRPA